MEVKSFLKSNTMRGLILGVFTFLGGHFGWLQGFATDGNVSAIQDVLYSLSVLITGYGVRNAMGDGS